METTIGQVQAISRGGRLGWAFLVGVSALLVLHGTLWFFQGPDSALASIAERTSIGPAGFQEGSPSASDIITMNARNLSIAEAALGLVALLAAWHGLRHSSRWAWNATWVLVLAFAAVALNLFLLGGIGIAIGSVFLGITALVAIAQLLARKSLAD